MNVSAKKSGSLDQQFDRSQTTNHSNVPEWAKSISSHLMSEALRITASGNLLIKRNDAREDESQWHELDLWDCYLPETNLLPACRATDDEGLCIAIALCVDIYLQGAVKSKAQHKTAVIRALAVVKLWEYGRLHDVYRLEDFTPGLFEKLESELCEGGWKKALKLQDRIRVLLAKNPSQLYLDLKRARFSLGQVFRKALGTTASGRELGPYKTEVNTALGIRSEEVNRLEKGDERLSASGLRQIFGPINDLSRLPNEYSLKFVPFPQYWNVSKSRGKPGVRTKNLSIEQAVPLLEQAFTWVYLKSEHAVELLNHINIGLEQIRLIDACREVKVLLREELMHSPFVTSALEQLHTQSASGQTSGSCSGRVDPYKAVNAVIEQIMGSCFLIIAVMNARRRDEVLHKKFGIHAKSMRVISKEKKIYECSFYIEKTHKAYVPFLVNEASFRAFTLLSNVRESFVRHSQGEQIEVLGNETLFRCSTITKTYGLKNDHWYDFRFDRAGAGQRYVQSISSLEKAPRTTAHMFRRFYAVIFIYRYENGTLLALMQQLGHFNLEMARQYVTDAIATKNSDRISIDVLRSNREVQQGFIQALDAEIAAVSSEKLTRTIEAILDGKKYAGKFEQYVLRLHNKLMARVEYQMFNSTKRAGEMAKMLEYHGHNLLVFRHGECMAGSGRQSRLSHCYSEADGGPAKQNASPKTCLKCPYHHVSEGYVQSLEVLLSETEAQKDIFSKGSVKFEAIQAQSSSIRFVISKHRERLLIDKA